MTINSAQLAALRDIELTPDASGQFYWMYPTLRALASKGLVAVNSQVFGSSARDLQYRLTNEGHAVLAENAEREK